MNATMDALCIVGGSVLFSVAGMILVRRRFSSHDFREHHDVAGYLLSVVGTLYAVLLGLIVVNVQSKFDQARSMAQTEANSCSDIWQLTRAFPADARRRIRIPLKEYYTVVQSEDWNAVGVGEQVEQSIPAYQALWREMTDYEPQGNKAQACYACMLNSMSQLADARRFRLLAFKRVLSPVVWLVLITGGILTIIFTYFFSVKSPKIQGVLIVFVALFLSLNILLVRLFDDPYRPELQVKSGSFNMKPSVFDDNAREGAGAAPGTVKIFHSPIEGQEGTVPESAPPWAPVSGHPKPPGSAPGTASGTK